jgi:hypothetical protein
MFFLRYMGVDPPAAAVVQAAAARGELPVIFLDAPPSKGDYSLIDRALAVANELPENVAPPAPGLGYRGFSADQRAALHAWIDHPDTAAPPAFQQFLLANAEVRLLQGDETAAQAHQHLLPLAVAPPWQGHAGLARALLLSFWLRQEGAGLVQWLKVFPLPPDLWRVALGLQALLGQPLHADQLPPLAAAWQLPLPQVNEAVLRLRLDSLQTALGQEPLAYALGKLGEAARAPLPWRCQHRDLRLALPQPDVRPLIEPLLRDLLTVVEPPVEAAVLGNERSEATETPPAAAAEPDALLTDRQVKKRKQGRNPAEEKARLILEFGASRSDVFDYVLRQAQKQPGFQQIMDENRYMVYRVPFRSSNMRHFWQIWGYVQNWASTRVYYEGRELDKWQVYPYSQYLR